MSSKHNTGRRSTDKRHIAPPIAGVGGRAVRQPNGSYRLSGASPAQDAADRLAANLQSHARALGTHAEQPEALPSIMPLDPVHRSEFANMLVLINEAQIEEQKQRMIRSSLQYALARQVLERYGIDIMSEDNPYLLDLEGGIIRHKDATFPSPQPDPEPNPESGTHESIGAAVDDDHDSEDEDHDSDIAAVAQTDSHDSHDSGTLADGAHYAIHAPTGDAVSV